MPQARTSATRDRLLDAAGAVVHRDGAQALTLDAVAAEAGVSKGGLLYHFNSKRELVEAMVERWLGEFGSDIERADPHFVRGYVLASDPAGMTTDELGMLAALIADPALLGSVRAQYRIWQDRVEREGGDPVDATVARLAADGLWLAELLGMGPPQGPLRDRVVRRLLDLAEPLD